MEEFLKKIGVGLRPIDDPFFNEAYKFCKTFERTGITIEDDEELCHETMKEFPCNMLGCKATFKNLLDFEIHYNGSHRYVCGECKKIRPNSRLLEIHIQENHDSFFKVLSEKQPMFQCYVSECNLKFNNPVERREHCTVIHKFPKNFRFDESSKIVESPNKMEVDDAKPESTKKTKKYLNKNQKCKTFNAVLCNSECHVGDSSLPPKHCSMQSLLSFVPRQVTHKPQPKTPETKVKDSLESKSMDIGDA